jgi:hypothetical protein
MHGVLRLRAGGEELAAHDVAEHLADHIERDRSTSASYQSSMKMRVAARMFEYRAAEGEVALHGIPLR